MTQSIDYIIDTADGQRSITISPVNITPASGIQFATGQYELTEGDVGIGIITFTNNKDWAFDGITDIGENYIKQIAKFIRKIDRKPTGIIDTAQVDQNAAVAAENASQGSSKSLTIIVEDEGQPVDVRIEMNYPFYDVTIAGKATAQLEQDHHSNWFVTKGQLNDRMVQEIGRRISQHIAAA